MASPKPSSKRSQRSKPFNKYQKYSGLAIQMAVTIGVMAFIGFKLDGWLQLNFPVFLLLLTFSSFAGTMYRLVKSLEKDNLDE